MNSVNSVNNVLASVNFGTSNVQFCFVFWVTGIIRFTPATRCAIYPQRHWHIRRCPHPPTPPCLQQNEPRLYWPHKALTHSRLLSSSPPHPILPHSPRLSPAQCRTRIPQQRRHPPPSTYSRRLQPVLPPPPRPLLQPPRAAYVKRTFGFLMAVEDGTIEGRESEG